MDNGETGWGTNTPWVKAVSTLLMGWPAGPFKSMGRLPEAWACDSILTVFGGTLKSMKFVARWRRGWMPDGNRREDEP
jgi:hypothetical protein